MRNANPAAPIPSASISAKTSVTDSENPAEVTLQYAQALENRFDFVAARSAYRQLVATAPESGAAVWARGRLMEIDALIDEKAAYERIHQNAVRVLAHIGINIAENEPILETLMAADAIDFENQDAVFVPIKSTYVESCLEAAPRGISADPGLNAFGTGATPPFLKREGDELLRAASRPEFQEILELAADWKEAVGILSLPVQTDRTMVEFDCARAMDAAFSGLKMIPTRKMSNVETRYFRGREDWLDGTTLLTGLTPMSNMVAPFMRTAETGNNLLLLDLSIAGASGPNSPEALLTFIHAQVLFMVVLAQTLCPGIVCVHGGIPGVVDTAGDLSYSHRAQPVINAAMARLNRWVTGLPSAQSGGSSSETDDLAVAVEESEASRNTMRAYGVHMVRHALGALGNLNFFSMEKFEEDCRRELVAASRQPAPPVPAALHLPRDERALDAVREIAVRKNPRNTDHSLQHVDDFARWMADLDRAAAGPAEIPVKIQKVA